MTQRRKNLIARNVACLTTVLLLSNSSSGQLHINNIPENKWLVLAEEQYQNGFYNSSLSSSRQYLSQYKAATAPARPDDVDRAKYLIATSLLKLDTGSCVDSAIQFIEQTSNPAYKQRTAYALAQYYFRNNELANAIVYYELAGISNLTNAELANAKFELAYCYFNNQQFDKASPLFSSIKDYGGTYNVAGNYYYGLLAYNQGKYEDALQAFRKIENEQQYKNIVPYYIAEIHYFIGDRKKALDEALRIMNGREKSYYDNELHLLAAQVLFEDKRYGDALPYFEYYYENVEKIRKEDLYEMAFAYYRVNEWKNAIDKFKPLSNTRDSLGQTAMYLLGDCYLKTGDKNSARSAFGISADMPFNPAQQEASIFLSGKLSYETGYYDEAAGYMNSLLAGYPGSSYKDEAKTILSDLLIRTSNYTEAYKALQDVSKKDGNYGAVYQKVAYGYGVQQLQNGDNTQAMQLFKQSLQYPVNPAYTAVANFWYADAAYKQKQYDDVITHTQAFINNNANKNTIVRLSPAATLQNAYMNMGYAAMQQQNFEAAQNYFNRSQQAKDNNDALSVVNATLREADAVFMQKNYSHALALYNKVIETRGNEGEYARYQKAILLGLMGKNAEKAALLTTIMNAKPASVYSSDARYELALVHMDDSKYQLAITTLTPLTEASEKRNIVPKAWMKIGVAHQQLNEDAKAIEAFRHVVVEYPASDERMAALDALKSLYIESNQPGAYAALLKDNNIADADNNAVDSAYYAAAEAQYAAGNWEKAQQSFTKYVEEYPNGVFTTKAYYYKAESHYSLKEYKDALVAYEKVLAAPWSNFTENSARKAAVIAYNNKDYKSAISYYQLLRSNAMSNDNLLQAYRGMMESSYKTEQYESAAAYADTLMTLPGVDDKLRNEVLLYRARSLQQFNKHDDALAVYKQLEKSAVNTIAAEARYHVAEIYYSQNKMKEAEDAAANTIKNSGSNDYWVVKAYILLSDILVAQKDFFNAKATLQSVIKNTKIAELKQEANKKLEQVKTEEKKQSKLSEE